MEKKKKESKTEEILARRKKRWEKCEYGAPGAVEDLPFAASLYCCTNSNIGPKWRLEKWQDYVKEEGSSYGKHVNVSHQAYARFGTYDVYILNPKANLIECHECPEYKPKKSLMSYW